MNATVKANSHIACRAPVMLCRGLEKSLSERHGHGMASVSQTRPRCVIQMRKTQSKPLAARHGRGTAWARHVMCALAFRRTLYVLSLVLSTTWDSCKDLYVQLKVNGSFSICVFPPYQVLSKSSQRFPGKLNVRSGFLLFMQCSVYCIWASWS